MNCPSCGRPVSDTANICPRCKTHIYHEGQEKHDYKDNPKKAVMVDNKPLKKSRKGLIIVLVIIAILAILLGLFMFFMEPIMEYAKGASWLNWLVELIEGN